MSQLSDALLRYRPWRGQMKPPIYAAWAIARVGMLQLVRRKLFWFLYALALMIFFFFFYGQYLIVWIQQQTATQQISFGAFRVNAGDLTKFLDRLNLNGTAHTYGNFIWFQGYIAMIVLAFAGAVLVGNDFHHGSLPFYLSKPIGRRHYVLGKCLGIGLFVNMLTTLPAIILYIQAGLLYDWKTYYLDHWRELLGILGYGLILTVTMSLLLMAAAVWVKRTVPLIMIWTGLFVLARSLAAFLVDGQNFDPRWRLIDLWNNLYLLGLWCLGVERDTIRPSEQPEFWQAALVCGLLVVACLLILRRKVRAVEIVQ